MFTEDKIRNDLKRYDLIRRHQLFAEAYVEAKSVFREMSCKDMPMLSVPFKPVHLYMHVIPGFNTYFEPAKYTGWRRLRAVDVDVDMDAPLNIRFELNPAYAARRSF